MADDKSNLVTVVQHLANLVLSERDALCPYRHFDGPVVLDPDVGEAAPVPKPISHGFYALVA